MKLNDNVEVLNNKIEVGSTVVTCLKRKRAIVLSFIDNARMTVQWEETDEVGEVLRIAFVKA